VQPMGYLIGREPVGDQHCSPTEVLFRMRDIGSIPLHLQRVVPGTNKCQDPSRDLLHDVCDSRYYGSMVQWFNGVSQQRQATSGTVVQWGLCDDLL
jgi:hypothetical protein